MSETEPATPTWWTPPTAHRRRQPVPDQPVPPSPRRPRRLPAAATPRPGYPPPNQPYVPYGYVSPPSRTNGPAVASLVCGIVSIAGMMVCLLGGFAAVPGLVLGIIGLHRTKQSGVTEKGRGLAIAGIVTSAVGIVMLVLFIHLRRLRALPAADLTVSSDTSRRPLGAIDASAGQLDHELGEVAGEHVLGEQHRPAVGRRVTRSHTSAGEPTGTPSTSASAAGDSGPDGLGGPAERDVEQVVERRPATSARDRPAPSASGHHTVTRANGTPSTG